MSYNITLQGTAEAHRSPTLPPKNRKSSVSLCKILWLLVFLAASWLGRQMPAQAQMTTRSFAMQVSATVQESPAQITLSWPFNSLATGITIYKRPLAGSTDFTSGWTQIGQTAGFPTSFTDSQVAPGVLYEYKVTSTVLTSFDTCSGYIATGYRVPVNENRGKVILIVENTYAQDLTTELARLQQDLVGDGWTVVRHDVSRTDSFTNIKALIMADYSADPANVHSVFLFGNVPIPFAGPTAPDGHAGHYMPWPADVYYGTMHGQWYPAGPTASWGPYLANYSIPADVDLEVGRVDLSNMPIFAPKTEGDLLRQYLDKDHNFRHTVVTAQRRGLITDHFGYSPFLGSEDFAVSGYNTMAAHFGAGGIYDTLWGGNLDNDQTFPVLQKNSFLWTYICSGGLLDQYSGVYYTGVSADFAARDPQTVFMMTFGSTFGDWFPQDNFLRAALGSSTYTLTNLWSGRPRHYDHRMAMGMTVGDSVRINQNTGRETYTALMGDPTLRSYMVAPVSALSAQVSSGTVILNWTASPDSILGYCVYRATSANGPFTRLNQTLITPTTFTDTAPLGGTSVYMVRAIKLEASASGSYYNASQGVFQTVVLNGAFPSISMTSPTNNSVILTPQGVPAAIPLAVQTASPSNSVSRVDFYANGIKVATSTSPGVSYNTATVNAAPYTANWTSAAEGTYTIQAVATDNAGNWTVLPPVNVSVRALLKPQIGIILTTGAAQLPGGSFTVNAIAQTQSPNDHIERVQLFADGAQVAELKAADLPFTWLYSFNAQNSQQPLPYTLTWNNAPLGSHQLTAKAITNRGMSAISAPISVQVTGTPPPPVVSITSPANGDSVPLGASVPVTVKATPGVSNGTIASVALYVNGAKTAASTTAPFTMQWVTGQSGTYTLTAVATDNAGTSATSAPVSVTVLPAGSAVRINAGGGAVGNFSADAYFTGGSSYQFAQSVDLSGVTNPAPLAAYQSCRSAWDQITYSVSGQIPFGSCTVRMHFVESYWTTAGKRPTNVTINGSTVLSNFDPFTGAGGAFKAVIKEATVTADANGKVNIVFASPNNGGVLVSAIEVLSNGTSTPSLAAPTGLSAVPATGQIALTWNASAGATGYNVYRALSASGEGAMPYKSGVTAASFTDTSVATGTTYYYTVSAYTTSAQSAASNEASAKLTAVSVTNTTYQLNAGGGATGTFAADNYYSGGLVYTYSNGIDLTGVTNPAPLAAYQSCRTAWDQFTYTLPGLTPSGSYKVRMHFVEPYWQVAGKRPTNVTINGSAVLSNFDPFTGAGGVFKAVVKEATVTADANGKISIVFASPNNGGVCVSAVEVLPIAQ